MWMKEAYDGKEDVTFKVTVTKSFANEFEKLINCLKASASPGHSFGIVVDPDASEGKGQSKFSMDGDGSDQIRSIERETKGAS